MALDKGIDDMENGRELSLDDAFILIDKMNIKRKQSRLFDDYLAEQMLDDEFRQEYESMKPEFDMVRALFFE